MKINFGVVFLALLVLAPMGFASSAVPVGRTMRVSNLMEISDVFANPQSQCRSRFDCPVRETCVRGWCRGSGGNGTGCRFSSDCPGDLVCRGLRCVEEGSGGNCHFSQDCPGEQVCRNNQCVD